MTVGVAILSDGNLINAWDFSATHPLSFYKWVYSEVVEGDYDMIVVEDYVGAGSMSKVAGHTIRQIGFIERPVPPRGTAIRPSKSINSYSVHQASRGSRSQEPRKT